MNLTESKESSNPLSEVITSMEGAKRCGLALFAIVFGVFGLWAALAPLDGAAFAPGSVTVKSYTKAVQHLEGGIVSDILVEEGDLVNSGQPLLMLDTTQASASLEVANGLYFALKVRESRLIAERDGLSTVAYPAELSRADDRVREEIAAQDEIFKARTAAYEGRQHILEQRINQLQSQIVGMEALRESKNILAESFREELEDTQTLLAQGFSEKNRLRQSQRSFASASGEAAELTANIATTEVQIGETQLQILQQASELQNEVVAELSEVQTSLKDVNERITALRDVVSRTTIAAPDTGVVTGMQYHTIGGVIGAGATIAEIVPQSDELVVEASVSPVDIDRVTEGQEARIRFSTFGSRAPTINGRVLSLSADSMISEMTGAPYYLARIDVDDTSLEQLDGQALIPGMPAEVYINTGSRTLLQYLFKPFSNAIARSFNED